MKSKLIFVAASLFAVSSASAAVTYVDATLSNTYRPDGSALMSGTDYLNNTNNTSMWNYRTISGVNGDALFSSGDANPSVAPALMTMITGLTAGENYDIYVYFWGQGTTKTDHNWKIGAGTAADAITPYSIKADKTSTAPLGNILTLSENYATTTALANPEINTTDFTTGVVVGRTDVRLYGVSLGTLMADLNGEISVYIDDGGGTTNSTRIWYDGLGYEVAAIPEPSEYALMAGGLMFGISLVARRRRKGD